MNKSHLLPFIFIVLIAFCLRLYQLPARAIFTADEEYQATYAQTIVNDFHPVWIGVSAAGTGFYLGPYFTYLTAGLLKLSSNPLILNSAACFFGALTAGLLFLLGSGLFDKRVGVLAGLLYAFSPLVVYFDQRYWNPSPIPLLTVFLLWCLYQLKSNGWWLVGVALSVGAIWHVHLSLVPLIPLVIVYVWQLRRKITLKVWSVSLISLLIMLSPLIIFDYYHDFSNLKTPLRMLEKHESKLNLGKNISLLGTTLTRVLYLRPGFSNDSEVKFNCAGENTVPPAVYSIIPFLLLTYFLLRSKKHRLLLGGSLLLLALAFIFYPGLVMSYYALSLFPLYLLALAYLFRRYWWLVLPVFIFLSIRTLVAADPGYGIGAKRILIGQVLAKIGSEPFALEEAGTCHAYAGWRFLFISYGRKPAVSSADASLGWLYPNDAKEVPLYHLTIGIKSEFTPPASPLSTIEAGHYTAYIEKETQ